ncbi:DUF1707 domain-containing protein [Pseudonocardia sp. RS11V-5]|uniref:DUF1707 SHOCT-like domain-containing protein n=1 Tax=Pseudonocardia terrae TaxID=2905831 RepID=UPI001E2B73EB|nr:DUF1707 domain-containing protein [Pseudonocardia terrae]MCE3554215.1 DUF1707 domain-containing protein [Pseudonocardia terrae]
MTTTATGAGTASAHPRHDTPTGAHHPPSAPGAGRVRCSDAEREHAAAVIHQAVGEGRLTMEEAEERLGRAYQARYRDELVALNADLPTLDTPVPNGWSALWAVLQAQLFREAEILVGREPAGWRRRAAALPVLLGPVLLALGAVMLLLHGVWDGHGGHGFDRDGLRAGAAAVTGRAAGTVGT